MNPKDIQGSAKPNLSVLPFAPLLEVIAALTEGRRKYGPWNWRAEKVSETIYADAAIRHLMQFIAGEDVDPDSGVHHISKAIAGLLVVRDAQLHGCSIDDRLVDQDLNIDAIKDQIVGVIEKYPNPVESDLPPRRADAGQTLAEAADEVLREYNEDVANGCSDVLLSANDVGRGIVNREGTLSTLELNSGSVRYPFQYEDGCILRTVNQYGLYHDEGVESDFDIVELVEEPQVVRGTPPSDSLVQMVEKLAEYYGVSDIVEQRDGSVRSWSVTVAGGGSYVIKPEDTGKTVVFRSGEVGTIDNAECDSSNWPVEALTDEWSDTVTRTGFADADAESNTDLGKELEEFDSDIVRVYHQGSP